MLVGGFFLGCIGPTSTDLFSLFAQYTGQDQLVIGRAAVAAARMAEEGTAPAKYWILEQADIVRLGRNEWKE